ncbi:MAG: isocitrate/isopropylmalate family dehydrogenase [Pseudonocardiaceae bacterium]
MSPTWVRRSSSRTARSEHIDALAARAVLDPRSLDVVLASNLFSDIMSDLTAAVAGSIGIAARSGHLPRMTRQAASTQGNIKIAQCQ